MLLKDYTAYIYFSFVQCCISYGYTHTRQIYIYIYAMSLLLYSILRVKLQKFRLFTGLFPTDPVYSQNTCFIPKKSGLFLKTSVYSEFKQVFFYLLNSNSEAILSLTEVFIKIFLMIVGLSFLIIMQIQTYFHTVNILYFLSF